MKAELVDRKCTKSPNSLDYRAIWSAGAHKLRVRRRRDAYADQSHAVIERWDGNKWHGVECIPPALMSTCREDTYVTRDETRPNKAETQDEQELLRLALLVIGDQ